ncbi:metal ABC transporter solute-binding protein, Zn/Mn family [Compostimonas suwonensis]|uniref:Zinc/manganese transport system substrate-binding protein n=1 Tax=Compostimonas suwonensis TaxID=1048394 RepID=A0A2M9C495_9MICO|nr:zinc ABC transporter substrate-binding protein [Compostimonas suwonensis]PJJ65332.1 zinc/manganese transport system substrate-binding protein [Compostimonas suwonensis]
MRLASPLRTPRPRTRRTPYLFAVPALAAASALVLAGCAATPSDEAGSSADSTGSTIAIVASTNVYGDIAEQIGGDLVSVTSIIDSPDKDPHEYEADARNQLVLSKAQIVIENGGGYDDFVDTMLSAADNADAVVLNAADISGYDQEPADGEFNEHVWYDFPTVEKVAGELVSALTQIDPDGAASFEANAQSFTDALGDLEAREAQLEASFAGGGVAITEPVPLYMLDAIGLVNKTPAEFSEAIEEDTDVAPAILQQTEDVFTAGSPVILVYNEQTTGPQTEAVLAAADANGAPVVPVTETLPDGQDYLGWMGATLDAIQAALETGSSSK